MEEHRCPDPRRDAPPLRLPVGHTPVMAKLIYGSGVRLMEYLRLRVKDLESDRWVLIVRDGKGAQDRVTVLPDSLIPLLKEHVQRVKALHEQDLARGCGAVYLPDALGRKYPYVVNRGGLAVRSPYDSSTTGD